MGQGQGREDQKNVVIQGATLCSNKGPFLAHHSPSFWHLPRTGDPDTQTPARAPTLIDTLDAQLPLPHTRDGNSICPKLGFDRQDLYMTYCKYAKLPTRLCVDRAHTSKLSSWRVKVGPRGTRTFSYTSSCRLTEYFPLSLPRLSDINIFFIMASGPQFLPEVEPKVEVRKAKKRKAKVPSLWND